MSSGYERLKHVGIPLVLAPSIHNGRKCKVDEFIKKICQAIKDQIQQYHEEKRQSNPNQPMSILPKALLASVGCVWDAVKLASYVRGELELAPWQVATEYSKNNDECIKIILMARLRKG